MDVAQAFKCMHDRETHIITTRDCEAILIPTAVPVKIPKGSPVSIVQALGDFFTIEIEGNLARISGKDADALGQNIPVISEFPSIYNTEILLTEALVWGVLSTCYDPEIPVNIVELGLIYSCRLEPDVEGGHNIYIQMTLTAPGCGMGPILQAEVEQKLKNLPGVNTVFVELVFDPPWDQSRMSEAAQLQLGML